MLGIVIVPSSWSASPKSISILPEPDFSFWLTMFFGQVLSSTAMSNFLTRNDVLIRLHPSLGPLAGLPNPGSPVARIHAPVEPVEQRFWRPASLADGKARPNIGRQWETELDFDDLATACRTGA